MHFDPRVFGERFHEFVQIEYTLFGSLGILFHVITIIILFSICLYGNKFKKLFTLYFTLNWGFLFSYWGIFGLIYWYKIGASYLLMYIIAPILLFLILYNWIREVKYGKIDFELTQVQKYRYFVVVILLWGFCYPTYYYGQGFEFQFSDFLFSYYGLMPCPTTMVTLSLMTLNYPRGNRTLFNLLTTYALFVGTATVLSGWIPDIPFVFLGIYASILIILDRLKHSNKSLSS